MKFHGVAVQALIYFDPDEWPATGPFIPHAPDLATSGDDGASNQQQQQQQAQQQQQQQAQQAPSPDPDSPQPMSPGSPPGTGTPPPPGTPPPAPAPSAVKPRPRLVDHPGRLQQYKRHILVSIGLEKKRHKRCRVCYINGLRKDTTKQCDLCKIPLCSRGPCFDAYHKKAKYWLSPPDIRGRGREGSRPTQQ